MHALHFNVLLIFGCFRGFVSWLPQVSISCLALRTCVLIQDFRRPNSHSVGFVASVGVNKQRAAFAVKDRNTQ